MIGQRERLAQRKALLIARADLERLHLSLAWRQLRSVVEPEIPPGRAAWARPRAATLLRFAVPLLGGEQAGRILRGLSLGLVIYRTIRHWRS